MRPCWIRISLALGLAGINMSNALLVSGEPTDVVGIWRGESACATDSPACHDESVVYYIQEVPNRSDLVHVRADKIIDGQAVTMGAAVWQYDRAQATLEWRTARQTWLLKVIAKRLEGTLTLADGTVFRKIALARDK
jgi:hypothetical protein